MIKAPPLSLSGRKIVVTRPPGQAEGLCRLIEDAGGLAIRLPVLEITATENNAAAIPLLSSIANFHIVIFISRNAAVYAERLSPGLMSRLEEVEVYAVGAGTGQQILDMTAGKANVTSTGTGGGSEALLELDGLQPDHLQGRKVLIIRGEGGRELLAQTLTQRGAEVVYAEVYRRARPAADPQLIKKIWQAERPDAIVITSGEGLQNLIDMTDPADQNILLHTPLVVLSTRLQTLAQTLGFTSAPEVAPEASDTGMLRALMHIFETQK